MRGRREVDPAIHLNFRRMAMTEVAQEDLEAVRDTLMRASHEVLRLVPEGREADCFLQHIEEAMFWANAAVARGGRAPR
jgi:hypothetical protein